MTPTTPTSGTLKRLQKMVARKLKVPPDEVPVDRPLLDLDLDSMTVVQLVTDIEEEFHPVRLELTEEAFTTLEELAAYIDRGRGA